MTTMEVTDVEKHASEEKLQEQVKEIQGYLDAERSSRTDLEMFVAVLNTQKGVLQEDCDKLRRELHNVCRLLEQEKMAHRELKQTWTLANEQFLQQQQTLQFEIDKMRTELTPAQMESVSREIRRQRSLQQQAPVLKTEAEQPYMIKNEQSASNLINFDVTDSGRPDSRSEHSESTVDTSTAMHSHITGLDSPNQSGADSPVTHRKQKQGSRLDQKASSSQGMGMSLSNTLLDTFFPAALSAKHFGEVMKGEESSININEKPLLLSSSSDSEDEDDLEEAILRQNMERYGIEEGVEVDEGANSPKKGNSMEKQLKKSSSSNDILSPVAPGSPQPLNEKSLSQGDVSRTAEQTMEEQIEQKLHLNETEWSSMAGEHPLTQTCMMCQNYEKQLQRLQAEFMSVKENEQVMADRLKLTKNELTVEKERIMTLEKSIASVSEDTQSQLKHYKNEQKLMEAQFEQITTQNEEFQKDVMEELKTLSEARDHMVAQCESLKEENEALRHSSKSGSSDVEVDRILNNYDDLKVQSEDSAEKLKSEIMFLKDRVMAEQFDRESTEKVLMADLEEARTEINKLQSELNSLRSNSSEQGTT